MTRRLALMLAIAVLLLVNTTIGEGGALDDIASHDGRQLAAADDAEATVRGDDTSTLAVASTSPWAISNSSTRTGEAPVIGTFGEESDVAPPAPPLPEAATRPSRSEPRVSRRSNGGTPEGALERHRMNIEE